MTEKPTELIGIPVVLFEDFKGRRITTDKRFGDKVHKAELSCPVPESDEDSQKFYGVSLAQLMELGVKTHVYGETWFAKAVKENEGNLDSEAFLDSLQAGFEAAVYRQPRAKGGVSTQKAQAQKWNQAKAKLGIESDDEMLEMIQKMQAAKKKK